MRAQIHIQISSTDAVLDQMFPFFEKAPTFALHLIGMAASALENWEDWALRHMLQSKRLELHW